MKNRDDCENIYGANVTATSPTTKTNNGFKKDFRHSTPKVTRIKLNNRVIIGNDSQVRGLTTYMGNQTL